MPKQTFFNLPEEKRQQIIDVAIDEFADNDYANASISKIVARAGIAKGSFYQYFEDKEDLYGYLISLIAEKKVEALSIDVPDPEHVGIFNYMRWLIASSVEFELAYPRLSQIGYRMLKGGVSENKIFDQAMATAQTYYRTMVALGKAQGDIAPDLDDELAATHFRLVMSEMGRYILKQVVAKYGSEWQGKQGVYDFPETQQMYGQLLRMLEFGMGNHPVPEIETEKE